MSEEMAVGLILGVIAAGAVGLAALKLAELHRKTKRTLARWRRTRLAVTQTARRKGGRR